MWKKDLDLCKGYYWNAQRKTGGSSALNLNKNADISIFLKTLLRNFLRICLNAQKSKHVIKISKTICTG